MGNTFSTVDVELVNDSTIVDTKIKFHCVYGDVVTPMKGTLRKLPRLISHIQLLIDEPYVYWAIAPETLQDHILDEYTPSDRKLLIEQMTHNCVAVDQPNIRFYPSVDGSVCMKLDRSNPRLWRVTLCPIRTKIRLRNTSTKTVTVQGYNPITVIPGSCTTLETFTDVVTHSGIPLRIRRYLNGSLLVHIEEDGLVFDCIDRDDCVHVVVTDSV